MLASVTDCTVFVASPGPGVGVFASSYYTRVSGGNLISIHAHTSRSDVTDIAYVRHSFDNGKIWGDAKEMPTTFDHKDGTGRRYERGGYVDPRSGRYVSVWTEGVLPTDDPLEGMKHWKLHYSVSEDGGISETVNEQIVHEGEQYDEVHHLPGITTGKNCVMLGDMGQRPLTRVDGVIMIPVQVTPTGPDGEYFNPGDAFTFTDCMLLFGEWRDDGSLSWTASERIVGDPERTTRGLIEPTIAELSDGSIIMIMRGSNALKPDLAGFRWISRSQDQGETWSEAEPWTLSNGERFHSPSSCSQLIPYSDGRLFWMGNICHDNPRGNNPRYPIALGEVDKDTGALIKDSACIVDDIQDGESPYLTLSNFYVREDRETSELLLHMTRLFANDFREGGETIWDADALLYRIAVE